MVFCGLEIIRSSTEITLSARITPVEQIVEAQGGRHVFRRPGTLT